VTSIYQSKLERVVRAPLLRLAVLYILIGTVYAAFTPLFEKPDEDGHYGYILYLREHYALPPLSFSEGFPSEYKQPPLYYAVTSMLTSWLPHVTEPSRLLATNPYMDFSVPGHRNDNRNVFLHPPHMTSLILGARLVSLLFGLGTMITTYFLALQLFAKSSLVPIAAAAVTAFQPQFMYMATAVNNDVAIAFFGTLAIAILIYRLQRGNFAHFAVAMGSVLGLASITKVSGLIFFPLTGIGLLFIHGGFRRTFFRDSLIIVGIALLIGGWWYARNALVYDDPLSIGVHTLGDTTARSLGNRIGHDLLSIEHTFWANPSRTFVSQIWLDRVLVWWGRTSLGLLSLGLLLRNRPGQIHPTLRFTFHTAHGTRHAWILLLSWAATFPLLLVTYWTKDAAWAYGRLLFPAIAPIGLLFILGWLYGFPWRWRTIVMPLGAGTLMISSMLVPFVSIYPMYHPWHRLAEEQIEHRVNTIYIDPDTGTQIAQLIGYNLPEPYALPGTYLPVELCWKPLAQTDVPYAIFVQLLDLSRLKDHSSPGVWGGRRTYPGLGNLPTDRWTPGQSFCDTVLVQVLPTAPTPLGAAIEIGFIDPETDDRLQPTSAEGHHLELAAGRGVPILSPNELPTDEQPVSYVLDDAIGLVHAQIARAMEDTITLTLTWQSLQPIPYDATTFVHLKAKDDALLAQADCQPLEGRLPTSYWIPGQVITDTINLPLTRDSYDGPFVLTVGMYIWPSLERLSVADASGNPQRDDAITIHVPPVLPGSEVVVP
jgi:4-amino-4-deoxy-L-arabinose transferase-like glycosyltransferase